VLRVYVCQPNSVLRLLVCRSELGDDDCFFVALCRVRSCFGVAVEWLNVRLMSGLCPAYVWVIVGS
jgi:hypothetical protein